MSRSSSARRALAQGLKALQASAPGAEAAVATSGRAFGSLSAASARAGLLAAVARPSGAGLAAKARCSCGKMFCGGAHFTSSASTAQAEPAMSEGPHAPSLTARHLEVRP